MHESFQPVIDDIHSEYLYIFLLFWLSFLSFAFSFAYMNQMFEFQVFPKKIN